MSQQRDGRSDAAADALSRMTGAEPQPEEPSIQQIYVAPGAHFHAEQSPPPPPSQAFVYVQPPPPQRSPGAGLIILLFVIVAGGAGYYFFVHRRGLGPIVDVPPGGWPSPHLVVPADPSPAGRETPKLSPEELRELANQRDAAGETALHHAARAGNASAVAEMIAMGADVDAVSKSRWTPLHLAAWGGHAAAAEVLIRNGADPYAVGEASQTPLEIAQKQGHARLVEMIREARRGRRPK